MSDTNSRFPYQHLAVIGMEKLKKYVPPAASSTGTSQSDSQSDASRGTTTPPKRDA